MCNKDVHVISVETLDDEYQANFKLPWLVQFADGEIIEFATEDEACDYQWQHRNNNGLDPQTGEPVAGVALSN